MLARAWPSYRQWFLKEGDGARPDLASSRRALQRHMPELMPLWTELVELSDGSEEVARMLSSYCPTPFLSGCSQACWTRGDPMLVRNYDYNPAMSEGVFVRSQWLGTNVMAASDCLWGVLDGVNEHGLVVALAFGGRQAVGKGFGIPLILRYVLETCGSTEDAIAVLRRVPSHMAYNVSVLDAGGRRVVVFVGPDRPVAVMERDVATNHQQIGDWPRYARVSRSVERLEFLEKHVGDPGLGADEFMALFLEPPLYKTAYGRGRGTLYTASYSPGTRAAAYSWPGARVDQALDRFEERDLVVRFEDTAPARAAD